MSRRLAFRWFWGGVIAFLVAYNAALQHRLLRVEKEAKDNAKIARFLFGTVSPGPGLPEFDAQEIVAGFDGATYTLGQRLTRWPRLTPAWETRDPERMEPVAEGD